MFDSRHESYQGNLETAQKIGDLVGKSSEMKAKINEHNDYIANIAKNLGVQGKKPHLVLPEKINLISKMTMAMWVVS